MRTIAIALLLIGCEASGTKTEKVSIAQNTRTKAEGK